MVDPVIAGSQNWNIYPTSALANPENGASYNPRDFLIVPAGWSQAHADSLAAEVNTLLLTSDVGLEAAAGVMVGAFERGGSEDLQRSSAYGIPSGDYVPAFTDAASWYLGYVTAKSGIPLYAAASVGGLGNLGKDTSAKDTLSQANLANINLGFLDGNLAAGLGDSGGGSTNDLRFSSNNTVSTSVTYNATILDSSGLLSDVAISGLQRAGRRAKRPHLRRGLLVERRLVHHLSRKRWQCGRRRDNGHGQQCHRKREHARRQFQDAHRQYRSGASDLTFGMMPGLSQSSCAGHILMRRLAEAWNRALPFFIVTYCLAVIVGAVSAATGDSVWVWFHGYESAAGVTRLTAFTDLLEQFVLKVPIYSFLAFVPALVPAIFLYSIIEVFDIRGVWFHLAAGWICALPPSVFMLRWITNNFTYHEAERFVAAHSLCGLGAGLVFLWAERWCQRKSTVR